MLWRDVQIVGFACTVPTFSKTSCYRVDFGKVNRTHARRLTLLSSVGSHKTKTIGLGQLTHLQVYNF
jgi:hypothetical protein